MTWSIVARDAAAGEIGIAVATCAFAVGARVPYVATGVGAVATQAFVNPFYGLRGLERLRAGEAPEAILAALTAADEGRGQRQVHLMDAQGRNAAYTGAECVPWCGHHLGEDFSVAGNMLAGPEVIAATARAFEAAAGHPRVPRRLAGMRAGEAAGGDKRGRQSAAIRIHDAQEYPMIDLRADDHPDPLAELERLVRVNGERFAHYRRFMPSRENPAGLTDRGEIERRIAESIAAAGQGA